MEGDGFHQSLLKHWVEGNDLHPEKVKRVPKKFVKRIEMGDQTVWDEVFKWYEKKD